MPRYEVLQDYRSGAFGPWEKGAKVELEEGQAAWVNRDASGTLRQIPPLGAESAAAEAAEAAEEAAGAGAMSTEDEGAPVTGTASPRRRSSGKRS